MTKEKLNSTEKLKKKASFKKKIKKWKDYIWKCLKRKKWPTTQKETDRLMENKIKKLKSKYDKVELVPDYYEAVVTKGGKSKVVSLLDWEPVIPTDFREECSSKWVNKNLIIPTDFREECGSKWGEWTDEENWTDTKDWNK